MLDAATTTETNSGLMRAGNLFCYMSPIKPGFLAQEESLTGRELVTQVLYEDWISSFAEHPLCQLGHRPPVGDPVKAMEFLEFASPTANLKTS